MKQFFALLVAISVSLSATAVAAPQTEKQQERLVAEEIERQLLECDKRYYEKLSLLARVNNERINYNSEEIRKICLVIISQQ